MSWDGSVRRVISGYRPQYVVNSNYHTSVQHRFIDAESVSTGQKAKAEVWFITPDAYPRALWEGLVLDVAEGAKVVGRATILKVHNPLLLGSAGRTTDPSC
jgi:translation elongation factor EF-Tu-like GTPase